MNDLFNSISNFFGFIVQQLTNIVEMFKIATRAGTYLITCLAYLPLYVKGVVIPLIGIAIIYMVLKFS